MARTIRIGLAVKTRLAAHRRSDCVQQTKEAMVIGDNNYVHMYLFDSRYGNYNLCMIPVTSSLTHNEQ